MDPKKVEVIDRFTQAISVHGTSLVQETTNAQGYAKGSPLDFLMPSQANMEASNYFNHRLQQVSLTKGSGIDKSFKLQPAFQERIRQFVATKSDLLFQMKGRKELRRGLDYGLDNNQEVLDLYSKVPPLEVFMGIPAHVKLWQLFKLMKEGDVVLGEVVSKRPFGIFVKLTALEFSKTRDFTDTNIEALCRTIDLDARDTHREHKDPADAFLIGDFVRGVITSVSLEEQQLAISFNSAKLPEQHQHLRLGLLEDVDPSQERYEYSESQTYAEHLQTHVGLNNPRNIETLLDILGVNTRQSCSLLRSLQRVDYPEDEYYDILRKKQSAKWSLESTAKGVELFKAGDIKTAMKYLEHALQIDGENVEALVARGALSANEGKYSISIIDFRQALAINSHHRNANKYLVQTLIEQGIQQEKNGSLAEALQSFKEVLDLNPEQATAKERLENVKELLSIKRQKEEKHVQNESQDWTSKFSHVRQLIKDEQIRKKKKKKEKKKRKKQRSEKKKKTRRRSLTSSNTDDTWSYESDSKTGSPRRSSKGECVEKGKKTEQKTRMPFEDENSHAVIGAAHDKTNEVHSESQAIVMNPSSLASKTIHTETFQQTWLARSWNHRSPSISGETLLQEERSLEGASKTRVHQRKRARSVSRRSSRSRSGSSTDRGTARRSKSPDHSSSRKLLQRDTRSRSVSRRSSRSRSGSSTDRGTVRRSRRSPDHSSSRKLSRRDTRSRSVSRRSSRSRSGSSTDRGTVRRSRRSPDHSSSRKLSRRDTRSRSVSRRSSRSRSGSSTDRGTVRRSRRSPDHSSSRKLSQRDTRSRSVSKRSSRSQSGSSTDRGTVRRSRRSPDHSSSRKLSRSDTRSSRNSHREMRSRSSSRKANHSHVLSRRK